MNYNNVLRSTYSWVSLKSAAWYIAFFWISLPFIILLPGIFEKGLIYSTITKPVAVILYDILYIALVLGVIVLIQQCLTDKKQNCSKVDLRKLIDTVFLVFAELYCIFVWSLNVKFRKVQLLLIIASALSFYCVYILGITGILYVFALSLISYSFLVVYNFVRLFFTTIIFLNENDVGIKQAIRESWALTHNKSKDEANAIVLGSFVALVMFLFIYIALGAIASIVLGYFFINSLAVSIGFTVSAAFGLGPAIISYHYAMAEIFSQLKSHSDSSSSIKRILAHKVINQKRFAHKPKSKVIKKIKRSKR